MTTLISLEPESTLLELVLEQRTGRVLLNVLLAVLLLLLALALEPVVVQVQVEGLAQEQEQVLVLPMLALPLQELVPGRRSPVSSSAWLGVMRISKRRRVRTALSERLSSGERTSARRWPVAL